MGQEPLTGPTRAPDPTLPPDHDQVRDPAAIRRDIAGTRRDMDQTLDQIEDKVSPRRIAERRTERVRRGWRSLKENVVGSAEQTRDRVAGSGGATADTVRAAPDQLQQRTRGNPLAAGLIAFGAGLLAASALPKTAAEQQAAGTAAERLQPLREDLTAAGKQVASQAQEHAKQAAQSTKETAQDAAGAVQDDATDSARQLRDEGQQRAAGVRDSAQG